jgi:uncharacterized cysteine cluster protein YcgN (CxxCxxCC family)
MDDEPFWKTKSMAEMSPSEWESLCDGCGKCCLEKLQDADTGEICHTNVACKLLDTESCRCRDYRNRHRIVATCRKLTPQNVRRLTWLPSTCAYRLLAFGQPLADWHPLVCGDREQVHEAGQSARGRAVPARSAGRLEAHIVTWPE